MPSDLHQIAHLMHIIDLLLLRRILHDEHRIILREGFPVQPHRTLVRHQGYALLGHEPPQHLAVLKILLAVFIGLLPGILIDHILISGHREIMHLYRAVDIYILLFPAFLHISHKESADRAASRPLAFLTKLCKEGVHIILHIDLRAVAHISYLTNIFWYLSFHLYSPLI